jgi:hypothetical protein
MNFFNESNNKRITIACLFVAVVCIYFINDDSLFTSRSDNSANVIGGFKRAKKDVRRKSSFNYFWDNIRNSDRLFEGDSIYTGPDSGVTVRLVNGQKIVIEPNSLIKFSMKNKKMHLDIPFGSLKMDSVASNDMVISDCGLEYPLMGPDPSGLNFSKSEKCGIVNVNTKSVKLKNSFIPKTAKLDIKNLFYEIESSGALREIIQTGVVVEAPSEPAPPLVEVVVDTPATVEESAPAPVIVREKLRLKAPRFEQNLMQYKAGYDDSVLVKWSKVSGAVSYKLDVSNSAQFDKVRSVVTKSLEHLVTDLDEKMYFRVQALPPKEIQPPADLSAPLLTNSVFSSNAELTGVNSKIELAEKEIVKNYKAKNPTDKALPIDFSINWTEIPKAEEYQVELIDPQTNEKISQVSSRRPSSVVAAVKPGQYKYQVHAIDKKGRKVSSSDVGEIVYNSVFSLVAPTVEEQFKGMFFFFQNKAAKYVWLVWSSEEKSAQFKVEVSFDSDFKKIFKSALTTKPKLLITNQLESREYFWRVRVQNKDQYSDWSETQKFKVQISSN